MTPKVEKNVLECMPRTVEIKLLPVSYMPVSCKFIALFFLAELKPRGQQSPRSDHKVEDSRPSPLTTETPSAYPSSNQPPLILVITFP